MTVESAGVAAGTVERPLDQDVALPEVDFGSAPLADIHEAIGTLRERGRFFPVNRHGTKALLVTRYSDVEVAFGDEVDIPLAHGARIFAEPAQGRSLFSMTGQEHRLHRSLVAAAFTPSAIDRYERELIVPEARERLAKLSIGPDGPVDLVSGFTEDFGIAVIVRILGLPSTDNARFQRWAHDLVSSERRLDIALQASREFEAYVLPIIRARREAPQGDLISRMAAAEIDGKRLSDIDIVSFLRVLFPAGADTTFRQLGNFFVHMLSLPGLRDALAADRQLIGGAIDEMLRWEPAIGLYPRIVPRDMVWRGAFVPANTMMLLAVAAANRDPRQFDDPESFRLHRRAKRIATFGAGIHFCIGAVLARREMSAAINALLDIYPDARLAGTRPAIVGPVLRGPARIEVLAG